MNGSKLNDYVPDAESQSEKTITIAHVDEPHDLYGGRAAGGTRHMNNASTPTKRGWLGNPYRVDDHGRDGCIEKFREDFYAKLWDDWRFCNACIGLPGRVVACYCRSMDEDEPACHLDVVQEALLEGHVFRIALNVHDIKIPEWMEEASCAPEDLL